MPPRGPSAANQQHGVMLFGVPAPPVLPFSAMLKKRCGGGLSDRDQYPKDPWFWLLTIALIG